MVKKSKSPPECAIRVTTYAELEGYTKAFAEGHLGLLIICGDAGVGKSRAVRQVIGNSACWIDGNASAFGIYLKAYEHRDRPIVLDDVDDLTRDRNGVRLLKSLCQTEPVKTVSWHTATPALQGIPNEFTTTSHVVIIGNEWRTSNANVAAVEDRGHFLHFAPTALEVHQRAATFFWDQEIFDFVAAHLHLLRQPSLRVYHRAWELKQGRLDWRQAVLSGCLTGSTLAVALLKADPTLKTEEERVQAFVRSGRGSRSTFFNHSRKIVSHQPVTRITLPHMAPANFNGKGLRAGGLQPSNSKFGETASQAQVPDQHRKLSVC